MKKIIPLALFACWQLSAQEVNDSRGIKSAEQIQLELDQAERDFQTAQKMFIPWYTGPLITGSANNVPKRKVNVQVYLYFTTQYAQFTKNWKSENVPNVYTLNPLILIQRGLSDWLDFTFIGQWLFKWRKDAYTQHCGDTSTQFGFQLLKQDAHRPSIRLVLGESYPTGKFRNLNPNKNGIDATGAGAYQTSIGLNFNKIFWQIKLHPISLRITGQYVIPDAKVKVRNFHAYGGGLGTRGKVKVGQTLNIDIGVEVSLTQHWVFANDIAYTHSFKSTFHGRPGVTAAGTPAVNGAPSSDQLSLAPAIEYNFNSKAGLIGGVWFTVAGRNSANFVSAVLSYTQLF